MWNYQLGLSEGYMPTNWLHVLVISMYWASIATTTASSQD